MTIAQHEPPLFSGVPRELIATPAGSDDNSKAGAPSLFWRAV